jgi:hypothetical protein
MLSDAAGAPRCCGWRSGKVHADRTSEFAKDKTPKGHAAQALQHHESPMALARVWHREGRRRNMHCVVLGHHPTVASGKIHLGRRLLQGHDRGGGNQIDPHVVKLSNENVGDLRDRQRSREGAGKKLKANGSVERGPWSVDREVEKEQAKS